MTRAIKPPRRNDSSTLRTTFFTNQGGDVAAPVLVVAIVLNGLLVLDQELLIPSMVDKIVREHDEIALASTSSFPIRAIEVGSHAPNALCCRIHHRFAAPPTSLRP